MMKTHLGIVLLFSCISSIAALSCITCKTGTIGECLEIQSSKICQEKYAVCMTISYYSKRGFRNGTKHYEPYFMKSCIGMPKDGCQSMCYELQQSDVTNCQIDCCEGDNCNKNIPLIKSIPSADAVSSWQVSSSTKITTTITILILFLPYII